MLEIIMILITVTIICSALVYTGNLKKQKPTTDPQTASRAEWIVREINPDDYQTRHSKKVKQAYIHLTDNDYFVIGTDSDCHFKLKGKYIDSNHLVIYKDKNNNYYAADNDSDNGTFINGNCIRSPFLLEHEKIVCIGGTYLIFLKNSPVKTPSDKSSSFGNGVEWCTSVLKRNQFCSGNSQTKILNSPASNHSGEVKTEIFGVISPNGEIEPKTKVYTPKNNDIDTAKTRVFDMISPNGEIEPKTKVYTPKNNNTDTAKTRVFDVISPNGEIEPKTKVYTPKNNDIDTAETKIFGAIS